MYLKSSQTLVVSSTILIPPLEIVSVIFFFPFRCMKYKYFTPAICVHTATHNKALVQNGMHVCGTTTVHTVETILIIKYVINSEDYYEIK